MADKVNAFALQQKAKAIEAGLIHEAPAEDPATSRGGVHLYEEIKKELKELRSLMSTAEKNKTRKEPKKVSIACTSREGRSHDAQVSSESSIRLSKLKLLLGL